MCVLQHAHIENIKTVANLSNNKDVFMCILRFHARAGYLQHYETLLKELNGHPASDPVPPDQYHQQTQILLLAIIGYYWVPIIANNYD